MLKKYYLVGSGKKRTLHVVANFRHLVGVLCVLRMGLIAWREINRAEAVAFFRLGFPVKNWGG